MARTYYDGKREYEDEQARRVRELLEKLKKQEFCPVCGRRLTKKNVKGMCVQCENIVCNNCGKIKRGKIICADCREEELTKKCPKCDEEFVLDEKEMSKLERAGEIKFKCPYCKKLVLIEDEPFPKIKRDKRYEGIIPLWVVILGFFFYIIPGVVLLIIRHGQLKNRGLV